MEKIVTTNEEYKRVLMDAVKEGYRFAQTYRQKDGSLRVVFVQSNVMKSQANNDA